VNEIEISVHCDVCGTDQEVMGLAASDVLTILNHWNANHVTGHSDEERAAFYSSQVSARYHEERARNGDHDA
jgi:hypothetical protein